MAVLSNRLKADANLSTLTKLAYRSESEKQCTYVKDRCKFLLNCWRSAPRYRSWQSKATTSIIGWTIEVLAKNYTPFRQIAIQKWPIQNRFSQGGHCSKLALSSESQRDRILERYLDDAESKEKRRRLARDASDESRRDA